MWRPTPIFIFFSGNSRFLSVYFQVKEHHIIPTYNRNLYWIQYWTTIIILLCWDQLHSSHWNAKWVISQTWHPLRYQNDLLKNSCIKSLSWILIVLLCFVIGFPFFCSHLKLPIFRKKSVAVTNFCMLRNKNYNQGVVNEWLWFKYYYSI